MFENLKNLKNLASAMGQAKEMKAKFDEIQAQLARKTVEAESGAGAVKVVVNGKQDVLSIRLDKTMLSSLAGEGSDADLEMIEELITAAVNAALAKIRTVIQQEMSQMTGGLDIPGLDQLTDQL